MINFLLAILGFIVFWFVLQFLLVFMVWAVDVGPDTQSFGAFLKELWESQKRQ